MHFLRARPLKPALSLQGVEPPALCLSAYKPCGAPCQKLSHGMPHIETGVQSQAAKMEGIEQGYQNEIAELKDALAKKTAACDFLKGKLVSKSRVIIQQGKYIDRLDDELQLLKEQKQALVSETEVLLSRNMRMKDQLDLSQHLNQTLEKSQHLADILSSTLADERAAKRRRE